MKINNYLIKYIYISIILISISSVNQWTNLPIGNTFIWWSIYTSILLVFAKVKSIYYDTINDKNIFFLKSYFWWNIICVFRGLFVADNYWDWKQLVSNTMVLLLPLTINIATNKSLIQNIVSIWIKYALPLFFILLPFFKGEAIGRYLAPISFLLLFLPSINWKWKGLLFLFSVFVLLGDFDARSNIIKFSVAFILSLIYYLHFLPIKKILETIRFSMMIIPFVLFTLAISGIFNIFRMEDYIGERNIQSNVEGNKKVVDLTADTRTLIYQEVLNSAIKYNYTLFGRTPARGNESELFGYEISKTLNIGRYERYDNEVSILNIFTWTGSVGVIMYFFVFYWSSYLAINKSNNIFIKIIGLFVAFRWIYAWIEDFNRFDLSYVFLWIMICMCISESFRNMTNREFTLWIRGIFDKRYKYIESAKNENQKNEKKNSSFTHLP